MKKLGKLTLKEMGNSFNVINRSQARDLIGGGYWEWTPEGGWTYVLDEVTVTGGTAGLVANAQNELGVSEYPGEGDNPRIGDYFESVGGAYGSDTSDETPWCSAFVNFIVETSGFVGTDSAAAVSWLDWGTPVYGDPQPGDIAVRSDGHHVGIVTSVEGGTVYMISGNYGGAVAVSTATDYTFRRP